MNEMHEHEFKSFSKTLEFNPNLSKQDYDTFCPQNSIKEHIIKRSFEQSQNAIKSRCESVVFKG